MELTASLLALIVGFGGGYLFGTRRGGSGDAVSRGEYDKVIKDVARLDGQRGALETQLAEMRETLDERSEALRKKSEEAAAASAERKLLDDRIAKMEEQLKLQFENLANKVLDKNSVKFNEQSKTSLQELLNPLKERLAEFQKKVDDSFGTQAKEQFSLKEEIKRIVDVNEKMRLQTDGLTKALRGDVKAQGNWGEVMLERILEDAGAQEGFAYIAQGEGMGLKHIEDGSALKPDYVVKLPDSKHLIIDSKVSLTHYEQFCTAEDDVAKAAALKLYLNSIRAHVNGLAERRYQDSGLGTPDFVLMFMPIEGAYSLAMQNAPDLHSYAWDKRVVIVCPSTLFATMRTVASIWKIEMQNRNAQEIARRGGMLYDKFAGFIDDMQMIRKRLDMANESYDNALTKLKGRGGMLSQAEQLKELGVKSSKSIAAELLDGDDNPLPALSEAS